MRSSSRKACDAADAPRHRRRTTSALEIELRHIAGIGIEAIHDRVACLTTCLLETLQLLRHTSGMPLARTYCPADTRRRGGTTAFSFSDRKGTSRDFRSVINWP